MSNQEDNVNESIMQMITHLKPRMSEFANFQFNSIEGIKRTLSINSNSSVEEGTPIKKQKLLPKDDSMFIGSPREVRRMRADLLEARNTILNLENRIKHMHSVRKEMEIMFDNETVSLKKQHEHDRKTIEELESHLQSIRQREVETKAQLSEISNLYESSKLKYTERVEELEQLLDHIKQESSLQEEEYQDEIRELKRKLTENDTILKAAQLDAEAQQKLNEELMKSLSTKNSIERDLELKEQALQKAQLKIKELEYARESYLEFQQQAKTQQHKLSTYADLERENNRVKEENVRIKDQIRNKLLLEEEVHDLKNRLVNFKEQEKRLAALQVTHAQMEMQLEEWKAVGRGICESTGSDASLPHLLRKTVEKLQHQEINLTAEKVHLESQLNAALHEAKIARSELEKNQKHLTELQTTVQERQNLIHRMQKKLLLVSRERDSYRQQLDSYERDLTMCVNPASVGSQGGNQLHSQKERIDNLEKIIEGYRDMVSKLETDLQGVDPTVHSEVPIRNEQLQQLHKELDQLKSENEQLRERKDRLEIQLEHYLEGIDRNEGHIYHLEKNPLSEYLEQREAKTEKLQEEVERLKRKIKNMEEGLEGSKLDDLSMCPKEKQALKEQINTLEVQNQRLKEYFKSSAQEFRNIVYMLLGYKVDKTSNSQYKLTSMYAETPNDYICFQLNQDGNLNLLENQFSARLEDLIDLHLQHQNSIPMFLSAITVDLFNNRTVTTRTYEID